jgi:hypothetical protein
MSDAQIFTELIDGKWHEAKLFQDGINYKCSCGCLFYKERMDNHIKESNPTYSNAADILNKMKEFCGEERYYTFIRKKGIGIVRKLTDYPINVYNVFIDETYILNPPALLKKAVEFLKGEG